MDYSKYLDEIIELNATQKEQLYNYFNLLVESSKVMNLTTITEEEDVYIKHFYDSILALKHLENTNDLTLLDIGSGAGLPGIVLKVAYPNAKITLLEPTTKRCNFLNSVIEKLNLKDIIVINDRAENYIKDRRESFDFVTARAVASLNILSELSLGFVKKGGYFIAMKGQNYLEELEISKNAINKMGGILEKTYTYTLPKDAGNRCILTIKKAKTTPNIYPRMYAKIKKNPL